MVDRPDHKDLKREIVKLKDFDSRGYNLLVSNFYVMSAALRYFAIKRHVSFTSSKIANNFPLPVTVAGSCLNVLEQLGVVEVRTVSSSPNLYLPEKVDLDKMALVGEILRDNYELESFQG